MYIIASNHLTKESQICDIFSTVKVFNAASRSLRRVIRKFIQIAGKQSLPCAVSTETYNK